MSRRRALIALVVLLVLTGCSDRPDFAVEHRTAVSAAKPLSPDGPPAGTYEEGWSTRISSGQAGDPDIALIGGRLVLATDRGIEAFDARTGKRTWRYREPGRKLARFAATDGTVVASFRVRGWHTVGLNANTGELRWDRPEPLTYSGEVADGTIVLAPDDGEERLGIEVRTGDERWQRRPADLASDDCAPLDGFPDPDQPATGVLSFGFGCANDSSRELLASLDAETGEPLWTRTAHGDVRVESAGPVTLLEADNAPPELIGRDGKTLFSPEHGACDRGCEVFFTGGRAVLSFQADKYDDVELLVVVDPSTGESSVLPGPAPAPHGPGYVPAGGRLYALQPVHGPTDPTYGSLLPGGLHVVDLTTNGFERAPMPNAGSDGYDEHAVAAGGGRLFTVRPEPGSDPYGERAVLTSYVSRSTARPVELGGVWPAEWPDPCELLAGIPRSGYEPHPPKLGEPVKLGDVSLPTIGCRHYGTVVYVRWVARTEREAVRLFGGGAWSSVGADEERERGAFGAELLYRVGRVIVSVRTDQPDFRPVHRKVVTNLRRVLR